MKPLLGIVAVACCLGGLHGLPTQQQSLQNELASENDGLSDPRASYVCMGLADAMANLHRSTDTEQWFPAEHGPEGDASGLRLCYNGLGQLALVISGSSGLPKRSSANFNPWVGKRTSSTSSSTQADTTFKPWMGKRSLLQHDVESTHNANTDDDDDDNEFRQYDVALVRRDGSTGFQWNRLKKGQSSTYSPLMTSLKRAMESASPSFQWGRLRRSSAQPGSTFQFGRL